MSGPELKPCPFCHGTHITDRYVRDGRQMFCQSCGASVAPTYHGPNGDTIERAITAWNTRTLPAQPAPAVGEWQPIETAPHDRSIALLSWFTYRTDPARKSWPVRYVGSWDDEAEQWIDNDGMELTDIEPSHWADLPALPAQGATT